MLKFAANLSFLYTELPFLERFGAAAKDGFKFVEFLFPYSFAAKDIAAQLQRYGLQQVLFNAPSGGTDAISIEAAWANGMRGTSCLADKQTVFERGVQLALDYAKTLQCPRIHVLSGSLPQGASREALQPLLIERLRWAAAQAAPLGIDILIEPLNPRDVPHYFINRQDHAHEIVQAVGLPNIKVQFDLYHCQIVEGDVAMKLRQYIPTGRVGHIQIAGVPTRNEPDLGEVNYSYLFQVIQELNYQGFVGCEYRPVRGAVLGGTTQGLGWLNTAH